MARRMLDTQLHDITARLLSLGTLADQALGQALTAVEHNDQALCGLVIGSDDSIDDLREEVERLALRSLMLQQPLGVRDLRFLSSIPSIAGDLERIGDNAAGIAKLLIRMDPLRPNEVHPLSVQASMLSEESHTKSVSHPVTETSIIEGVLALGQEARRVLQATVTGLACNDASATRTVWHEDDVVDVHYHMVRHDIMRLFSAVHAIPALEYDALVLQRVTYWLWIAHNLERVGDHCSSICTRIVFFLEGQSAMTRRGEDDLLG